MWLDLARSKDGQSIIVPLRMLKHWQRLDLLVPQVVIDEFERNRPIAETRVAQSVADRFRELRRDLHEYADPEQLDEWLSEMTHHVPLISAMTLQNFRRSANSSPTPSGWSRPQTITSKSSAARWTSALRFTCQRIASPTPC